MWIAAVAVLALVCYWVSTAFENGCIICHKRDRYCLACAAKTTQRLMKDNKFLDRGTNAGRTLAHLNRFPSSKHLRPEAPRTEP